MTSTDKYEEHFKVVKLLMKKENKELENDIKSNDNHEEELKQKKQKEEQEEKQGLKEDIRQELNEEIEVLRKQVDEVTQKSEDYLNMLQRTAAEFDNYKKRTQKEKELIKKDTTCDVVAEFIEVADNLRRALEFTENECNYQNVREGIELVYKQFNEILKNLKVEEIKCVGEKFDPNLHNAVLHVNDENYNESEVVEEFKRGYIMEDKVIRHSVVKVAN